MKYSCLLIQLALTECCCKKSNYRNVKVVMMTALVFTGDDESCLQRLQCSHPDHLSVSEINNRLALVQQMTRYRTGGKRHRFSKSQSFCEHTINTTLVSFSSYFGLYFIKDFTLMISKCTGQPRRTMLATGCQQRRLFHTQRFLQAIAYSYRTSVVSNSVNLYLMLWLLNIG